MVDTPRKRQFLENAATTEPAAPARTPTSPQTPPAVDGPMDRNLAVAVGRGLMGRCPNCGKGAMFRGYLSVNPRCPVCGEDLSFQRADDAPAFVTLLVVCFVGGAGVLVSDVASPHRFWLSLSSGLS
jgi:uncharacterized protein (DUF983 family)